MSVRLSSRSSLTYDSSADREEFLRVGKLRSTASAVLLVDKEFNFTLKFEKYTRKQLKSLGEEKGFSLRRHNRP